MTPTTKHFTETPEAMLDLVASRVAQLDGRLDTATPEDRERTRLHLGTISARNQQLRESLPIADPDHTIEVAHALLRVLDSLESDLHFVAFPELYPELDRLERQVRSWIGSVDNLRVQAALGRMNARDDVENLVDRSRGAWHRVAVALSVANRDGKQVAHDVGEVVHDLRDAARHIVHGQ